MMKNATSLDEEWLVRLESANQALSKAMPLGDLEAVIYLQQSCRPDLLSLTRYFATTPKLDVVLENRIVRIVGEHLQQSRVACTNHIKALMARQSKQQLMQLLLEKLQVMALIAKWCYMRYQPIPERYWLELHADYLLAERLRLDIPAFQSGYVHILMLDSINLSSMQKAEIEALDRWVAQWSVQVAVTAHCDDRPHAMFVDLGQDVGARRLRNFTPTENFRCWVIEMILRDLEQMREQLSAGAISLPILPDATTVRSAQIIDLLIMAWSDLREQRRRVERAAVSKLAQAVNGLFAVCQQIRNEAYRPTFLHPDDVQPLPNSWEVQNESVFGLGAVVNADLNLWVKPGALLSLQFALNPDMEVLAVVRSLQQRPGRELYVGLEVISYTPAYVQLTTEDPPADEEPIPGLYLGRDDDRNWPPSLLLPLQPQADVGELVMHLEHSDYRATLGDVLEQQADWVRIAVMVRD